MPRATWCALLVAACSSGSPSKEAPAPGQTSQGSAASGSAASGSSADPWSTSSAPAIAPAPTLNVETTGAEPRRVLAYSIDKVDRSVGFIGTEDGDGTFNAEMRYQLQCSPCRYSMTQFTVNGGIDPDMFAAIAKQVSGTITVAPDGKATVSGGLVKTTPSTTELFEMVIVPFPTEPVGVGAKWSVSTDTSTMVYTLASFTAQSALVELAGFEGTGDAVAHVTGKLAVSFADPVARGEITQRTAIKVTADDVFEQKLSFAVQ